MSCPIKPIQNVVILVKPQPEEVRESGIIIPMAFNDSEEYEVVAVGPGKYGNDGIQIPVSVRPGERVLCNPHQLQPTKLPDDPVIYFSCRDDPGSIRAVL